MEELEERHQVQINDPNPNPNPNPNPDPDPDPNLDHVPDPNQVIFDQSRGSREAYLLLRRSVQENLLSTVSDPSQFWGADDAARELRKEDYFKGGEEAWPAPLREAAAMKPPLALGAYGACVGYLKRLLLDKELVPLGSMAKWQPTDEVGSLPRARPQS